jgi:hypothetical protein
MRPAYRLYEAELPPTVRNLIRLAGWRGALAIVREMPGARIYSPATGEPDDARFHRVAELAGYRAAQRIYAEYRGGVLEIPNCKAALRAARDRWIRSEYDRGTPVEALCVATGISRRQIFDVLKKAGREIAPDETAFEVRGQMGLF